MKSEYYIATVINAYRRALDAYYAKGGEYKYDNLFLEELEKTAHREFTTAYFLGDNDKTVNYDDSQSKGTHKFVASVIESHNGEYAVVEMRNRFMIGDKLEVLSPSENFNKIIDVTKMQNERGEEIDDAKLVQQKIKLYTDIKLSAGDILRIKA